MSSLPSNIPIDASAFPDVSGWPSAKETAVRLGVSERTILRAIAAGKLASVNVGFGISDQRPRIDPASIAAVLHGGGIRQRRPTSKTVNHL